MARTPRQERPAGISPTAAPSSASDIGVYGLTPAALIATAALAPASASAAPARPDQTAEGRDAGVGGSASVPATPALPTPAPGAAASFAPWDAPITSVAGTAMTAFAIAQQFGAAAGTGSADTDAGTAPRAAQGSGTPPGLDGISEASLVDVPAPDATAPAGSAAPLTALTQPAGFVPVAGDPAATIDARLDAVGEQIAAVEERVADALGDANAATEAVVSRVDGIVADVAETAATLDDRVADAAAQVTRTVEALDDRVAAGVADAGETVEALGGRVAGSLAETVSAAVPAGFDGIVDGAIGAIDAPDLADLGGSDPLGGITTLVGMVSAADAFGFHDESAGGEPLPGIAFAPAGDLVDTLAPADVLLATHDHHGALGLLDGLTDDHFG